MVQGKNRAQWAFQNTSMAVTMVSMLFGQACQAVTVDESWQTHIAMQTQVPQSPPGTGPVVRVPVNDHDVLPPRIIARMLCARALAECVGNEDRLTYSYELLQREHSCTDNLEQMIQAGKHTSAQIIRYGGSSNFCFGILLDLLFKMIQPDGMSVADDAADLYCFKCDGPLSHILQASNVLVQVPEPERVRSSPPRNPGPSFPMGGSDNTSGLRQLELLQTPMVDLLQAIEEEHPAAWIQAYTMLSYMSESDFRAFKMITTWAASPAGPGIPLLAKTVTNAEALDMTGDEFQSWAIEHGFEPVAQTPRLGVFTDGNVVALIMNGAVFVIVAAVVVAAVLALAASGPPGWAVLVALGAGALLLSQPSNRVQAATELADEVQAAWASSQLPSELLPH